MSDTLEIATLGGGCFWCVEAVYLELQGVYSAVSGYAGGTVENPTYYQVCDGSTGHGLAGRSAAGRPAAALCRAQRGTRTTGSADGGTWFSLMTGAALTSSNGWS